MRAARAAGVLEAVGSPDLPPLELPIGSAASAGAHRSLAATVPATVDAGADRTHAALSAAQSGATLFMTLVSAFAALLHRYTGQTGPGDRHARRRTAIAPNSRGSSACSSTRWCCAPMSPCSRRFDCSSRE